MNLKHYIYGIIVTLIAIVAIVGLVIIKSQTDTASQSASVTNTSPTVDSVTIATTSQGASASTINLIENSTTTVYVHGAATDNNGCEEIDDAETDASWDVIMYRSD